MRMRILILASLIVLTGCEKIVEKRWNVPTDDPNWVAGHQEGVREGIDQGREQVCEEILHYKPAVARDLDENTEICGYDKWDGRNTRPN